MIDENNYLNEDLREYPPLPYERIDYIQLPLEVCEAIEERDLKKIEALFRSKTLNWEECMPSPLFVALCLYPSPLDIELDSKGIYPLKPRQILSKNKDISIFDLADFLLELGISINSDKNLLLDILKSELDELVYYSTDLKIDIGGIDLTITHYLLKKGIAVNNPYTYPSGAKLTPLDWAISNNLVDLINLLRAYGAKTYPEIYPESESL